MFVVQVDKFGIPANDMCSELIEACRYQNWYYGNNDKSIVLSTLEDDIVDLSNICSNKRLILGKIEFPIESIIPIGDIQFVEKYLKKPIKPINIPDSLNKPEFTHRKCQRVNRTELGAMMTGQELFIKSDSLLKDFSGIYSDIREVKITDNYFISEVVDFDCEWRSFIYRNQILDVRQYSGDWELAGSFNPKWLENIVSVYKSDPTAPTAYTLDFARCSDGQMALIECHNLVSCGLYSFGDYMKMPNMFTVAYKEEQNR